MHAAGGYLVLGFSALAVVFVVLGYLMLFTPSAYVTLRNWHFRTCGLRERLTLEECSRLSYRAAGLALFLWGLFMLYLAARGVFR